MAHAEALQTLDPVGPTTAALVEFVSELRYATIPDEARHYARRHLLDTVGVMIAGAGGDVASRAEAVLAAVRQAGRIPVPGCARRSNGQALMEAIVAGYETVIAIGRACHPDLRQRGFHPTAAVGVFGSAAAAGKLGALSTGRLANAFGLAASSAGGLFAFVNGGGDIKRLHAGHAAREGLQAALLADQGVEGPPGVLEARDGFMQAFARADRARAIAFPPAAPFGITDCYIKPYPCCRHIQPAVEALIGLLADGNSASDEVDRVEVASYRIAA